MKHLHADLLKIKNLHFFIGIMIFICLINCCIQYFFLNETIFYNTYADQLSFDRTKELLGNQKKIQFITYIIVPVLLLIKILYNSFWITSFSLLNNERGSFKSNFNICMKAEYVFVLMLIYKFSCLIIYKKVNNLNDLAYIPGSLANLLPVNDKTMWYLYPAQTVNIWELWYCFAGTLLYSTQHNIGKLQAALLFCVPYILGLLIWVLVVVFISLQFI